MERGGTEADKVTAPSAGLREDGRLLRLLEEELKAVESPGGVCDNEDAWLAARDGVEGRELAGTGNPELLHPTGAEGRDLPGVPTLPMSVRHG